MKKIVLILCLICIANRAHLNADDLCPPSCVDDPYPSPCMQECPCIPPPPRAPACGLECGISYYVIGVGIIAVAAAATIILLSGNGSVHDPQHNH